MWLCAVRLRRVAGDRPGPRKSVPDLSFGLRVNTDLLHQPVEEVLPYRIRTGLEEPVEVVEEGGDRSQVEFVGQGQA